MHPRKWAVLHQSKQTLGYVERKPLSFTRSTTNQKGWKEKSKRKPALTPENFLCVQLFFFLTPALLLGSIFYSLISSDLMVTWAKPSLLLFFLVTEGCFNMYSMAVVCTWLCVSVRQTSYTQPQSLDLHTRFGHLQAFCCMIWRCCVNCSTCWDSGALQNEWPPGSFLCQFALQGKLALACDLLWLLFCI